MKKFFLLVALMMATVSMSAQDISKYLYPNEELQALNVRRAELCLTMINSVGNTMYNGEICTLKNLPALIEADVAKKDPCYMLIITDVPKEHATFQAVARMYLAAAIKAHKKPIKIYWGKYEPAPLPPPPPVVEVIEVIEDEPETELIEISANDDAEVIEIGSAGDANDDEVVFAVVQSMPEFPGGTQAMYKFLSENVKYPEIAKANKIQGRCVCQFVVEKDGRLTNFEIVRSTGDASLDKEALRVLKSMPKWKPGHQKGKFVRVSYTIPVTFKL